MNLYLFERPEGSIERLCSFLLIFIVPILIGYFSGCSGGEDVIEDAGDVVTDVDGCSEECGSNASCRGGVRVCKTGYGNCNNNWSDGCECKINFSPRTYGGSGKDVAYSIQQTTDGGYIVAGETGSFGAGYYDDFWVLKLNSDGSVDGSCPSGIGAVSNATVNTTSATTANTTATVNTTSATVSSTSATVQDTSATTNMQCTMP